MIKMKENIFKLTFAAIVGGLSAYLNIMAVPVIVLLVVMIIDYATGMFKAWINASLSSRIGLIGILKKVGYLLVVCTAGVVDWLISSGLDKIGIKIDLGFYIGVIVVIWFIINELISILENLAIIGVPLPKFLTSLIHKLKVAVEGKVNTETEED